MRPQNLYTPSFLALSVAALTVNLGFGLPLAYFPFYALSLGASVSMIGVFTASFMATRALFSTRFGAYSDRVGRKRIIEMGLLGYVATAIFMALSWDWISLLVVRALQGVASAAVWPVAEASVVDQSPKERTGEALGFFLTLSLIGWFAGPFVGGVFQHIGQTILGLTLEESYRLPFFAISLLGATAALLIIWKVRETRGIRASNPTASIEGDVAKAVPSHRVAFYMKILFIFALSNGFAVGFVQPVGVLFLGDNFGVDPLIIGTIFSTAGFIGIGANYVAGRTADRTGRIPVIALGGYFSRIASLFMPLTSNLLQAGSVITARFLGISVSMPAVRALQADIVPERIRGRLFGKLQAFFNLGMIAGPIIGSWVYDLFQGSTYVLQISSITLVFLGGGIPFIMSGALGIAALTLLVLFVKEPSRRKRGAGITPQKFALGGVNDSTPPDS